MNETMEKIMNYARRAMSGYGGDDCYIMCEELSRRIQEEGRAALMQEYSLGGSDGEQIF